MRKSAAGRTMLGAVCLLALASSAALVVVSPASGGSFPGLSGKIAFDSDRDNPGMSQQIFTMNRDHSVHTLLNTGPSTNTVPYFSPDGQKIVFRSNRDGDSD